MLLVLSRIFFLFSSFLLGLFLVFVVSSSSLSCEDNRGSVGYMSLALLHPFCCCRSIDFGSWEGVCCMPLGRVPN
jgi:hypothetical protein